MRHTNNLLEQILGIFIAIISINASAETTTNSLADPTMPATSSLARAGDAETSNRPILQSVILGSKNKAAIIDGQKVTLGQKYQQSTLIQVTENQAVLCRSDRTVQVLKMDYAMDKKVIVPEDLSKLPQNKTRRFKSTNTYKARMP